MVIVMPTAKMRATLVRVMVLMVVITAAVSAQTAPPPATSCDQACLSKAMAGFVSAMTSHTPGSIPLADGAEVRENTLRVDIGGTAWQKVKAVRSVMTFADAVSGNVVSRAGVELVDGRPGYISTRLRIVPGGRISDVELSADTTNAVEAYVWHLDAAFSEVVPPEQRSSRHDLEALARRYFHSLSTHVAVAADFDERCNRFHSGRQITNVAGSRVEGGPARTCAGALEGTPPWGPATEHRFPVIDAERGIVLGLTLLHYPKMQRQMYVSEVFKVVAGRIVKIDNIGLMMQGVETLGFVH
jgi:hypothetical protein